MEDDRRYFLKQFRAGLQHCQSEMVDLSLDYKIPFKNRYFLAVNLLMLFSVQSLLHITRWRNLLSKCWTSSRRPVTLYLCSSQLTFNIKKEKRFNEWKLMKNVWKLGIKISVIIDVGEGRKYFNVWMGCELWIIFRRFKRNLHLWEEEEFQGSNRK